MTARLIMATRAHRPEHAPEAEPVLVELVRVDYGRGPTEVVHLELDDGETLELDATELRAAIAAGHSVRRAA